MYEQNDELSIASHSHRHGHDVRHEWYMNAEKDTVADRISRLLGGNDHQHSLVAHHQFAVPSSTSAPMQGIPSMLPWGHSSVPVRTWSANEMGIGIGFGIEEQQQDRDGDQHWRGHQHQNHQGGFMDSSIGQVELLHRATAIDHHMVEQKQNPIFVPTNETWAVGTRECGIAGSGASVREQAPRHSETFESLGKRKMSVSGSETASRPVSVKDTMSWPQVKSISWPLPPLAPLPPLPSILHQSQDSAHKNEIKGKAIAIPGGLEASSDAVDNDAPRQVPGSPTRNGGGQRLKRTCQYSNCRRSPSFSKAGQRALYCGQHKLDGMINVVSRKCVSPGCTKGPSYGPAEGKKPLFCSRHRLPDHINVVSPRCAQDGCSKGPSFGCIDTGNKATYCAKHKLAGMVNVVSRNCEEKGCRSAPSFGFEGERATFCGKHKRDGQRNVISRRCNGPGCTKVPSYGKPGDPRPSFCTRHKPPGSINLLSPRCAAPGCTKGPVRKHVGEKPRFCRVHSV
eukprot:g14730.t1